MSTGVNTNLLKPNGGAGEAEQILASMPTVGTVFELKSGARATLTDRSGTMVIIEVDKYRSDWIEWAEVKARIAIH